MVDSVDFILSDSPPEKDVQWLDSGVISSSKFLQKIWNLNQKIINKKNTKSDKTDEKKFVTKVDLYVYRIDNAINNFQFNVAIAQFYEAYRYFNECLNTKLSNEILINSIIKIMKLMIPFTPHLAYECLQNLKCKETDSWPNVDKKILDNIKINLVVQINGKTRDVLSVKKNLTELEINKLIQSNSKAKKYLVDKKITKTIFIKDKIINYIIKN